LYLFVATPHPTLQHSAVPSKKKVAEPCLLPYPGTHSFVTCIYMYMHTVHVQTIRYLNAVPLNNYRFLSYSFAPSGVGESVFAMLVTVAVLLLYFFLTTMTLSVLGRWFKKARFFSRLLTCYFLLMACTSYGLLASVVLRLIGKAGLAQWVTGRAFLAVSCPAVGVDFRVVGEEKLQTRPAVFMTNHQSELDLIILGRVGLPRPCSEHTSHC